MAPQIFRRFRFAPRAYLASILREARASFARVAQDRAALITIIVLILPWWSLIFLRDNVEWLWSFGEIAAIVLAFWWMSRSGALPAPAVKYPRAETLFALALIAAWMIWRTGICGKLFPFLPAEFVCYKNIAFEIVPKVIAMVVLPIIVLFWLGYRWRALGIDWNWRAWWIALPILLAMAAYGAWTHRNDWAGFAQRAIEFFFAAGLPEEVIFRAILLTRLEAWWRNSAWALFGASVIFGLSHLPINYLVFTSRDWNEAWLTLLTFQTGFGAAFAFAYQRTRNVLPLAVLHGLVNSL